MNSYLTLALTYCTLKKSSKEFLIFPNIAGTLMTDVLKRLETGPFTSTETRIMWLCCTSTLMLHSRYGANFRSFSNRLFLPLQSRRNERPGYLGTAARLRFNFLSLFSFPLERDALTERRVPHSPSGPRPGILVRVPRGSFADIFLLLDRAGGVFLM